MTMQGEEMVEIERVAKSQPQPLEEFQGAQTSVATGSQVCNGSCRSCWSKTQSPFRSCSPNGNCPLPPHTAAVRRGLQQLQNTGVCWWLKSSAISLQPECLVMSPASKHEATGPWLSEFGAMSLPAQSSAPLLQMHALGAQRTSLLVLTMFCVLLETGSPSHCSSGCP